MNDLFLEMKKTGPIVIIEDDEDDLDLFKLVFKKMNYDNDIYYFKDGEETLEFISSKGIKPFLIISDINLPKLSGLALRDKVQNNEDLRLRCIPYLFFTTSAARRDVIDAYSKSIQGFFVKPNSFVELERVMRNIVEYWKDCAAPNFTAGY